MDIGSNFQRSNARARAALTPTSMRPVKVVSLTPLIIADVVKNKVGPSEIGISKNAATFVKYESPLRYSFAALKSYQWFFS